MLTRHRARRGYTNTEFILIFIVTGLIIVLSAIYMQQSSKEAFVAGIKEQVKVEAKRVAETVAEDIKKSKKGTMEYSPLGKNGAKITFEILEGTTLMKLVYNYDRPKLSRKVKGKETMLGELISGLKMNEDYNSGEMEIEVTASFKPPEHAVPISHTEKVYSRARDSVPDDVKILTEDGIELEAGEGGGSTDEVQTAELDLFTQYANSNVMDLQKKKVELEYDIDGLKKREAEVNNDLTSNSPGLKHSTYPLLLPGIKDVFVLETAAEQPATDQKYVDLIKKKIEILGNQIKMKQELKVINSILAQREKK